ncbi:MAG TPA: pyridoxamine 5'-phosphate oxidase family protein [Anaerolineales bacterium]
MSEDTMTQPVLSIVRIVDPAGVLILASGITDSQVQRSVYRLLDENVLCSMASITAEGRAHINTAYFSYTPDLKVYFISHPNALHCQNIMSNPSMALAIFSSNQTWGSPDRGLQLFGVCKKAMGREVSKADKLYAQRFAEYTDWKTDLASDSLGRDYGFYRFVTVELKVFDEKEFGAGVFIVARVGSEVDATSGKLR